MAEIMETNTGEKFKFFLMIKLSVEHTPFMKINYVCFPLLYYQSMSQKSVIAF